MRERRKFFRYNCLVEIKYRSLDGKIEGYCFTKDLGEGGINLPSDRYIPPFNKLSLEIILPDADAKIVATGLIVWSRKNSCHWEALYSAGLEFENIDASSARKLAMFANTHQWRKSAFEQDLEENKVPLVE